MISTAVINLALLFRWIGLGASTRDYRGIGVSFVLIALLLQIPIILHDPNDFATMTLVLLFVGLFKLYLTTGVGLHYAQALQIPYSRTDESVPDVRNPVAVLLVKTHDGWFVAVIGALVFMLVITGLLFWVFDAKPPQLLLENAPEQVPPKLLLATAVFVGAFAEEILFRLGLQNWLSYAWGPSTRSHWIAVFVTTAIWTSGHAGMVDPNWVKFLQMLSLIHI